LSDEILLAGMAGGDQDAAAAFVRRYQARVYGLALTVVRSPALAEEVAQEAFLKAWRHAGTYDARRGRVATWLLTDHAQRGRRRRAVRTRVADGSRPPAGAPVRARHLSPEHDVEGVLMLRQALVDLRSSSDGRSYQMRSRG
jgi:RNA polymerase sigma-70 factor (ECF subfamily)